MLDLYPGFQGIMAKGILKNKFRSNKDIGKVGKYTNKIALLDLFPEFQLLRVRDKCWDMIHSSTETGQVDKNTSRNFSYMLDLCLELLEIKAKDKC